MVGANYMGGKRNTVRAKSKDIVGRAQRRHFGKQRLASALCVAQDNHVHPNATALPPVLPEIALAHARRNGSTESGATSRGEVMNGDRLYSSTLLSNTPRRNRPSKVLGVLDTSDHASMRAAINYILQQPSLIGIDTPEREDAAYTGHMQILAAIDAPLESEDVCRMVSQHAPSPRLPYSPIQRHKFPSHPGDNPKTQYTPTECDILSSPSPPSGICGLAPPDAFDDTGHTGVQSLTEVNPFLCAGDEPERFVDAIHTLPRSSPFPSSSQSSNDLIFHLRTLPCAALCAKRTDRLHRDVDCVDTSPLRSMPRPISCEPSRSFSVSKGSGGVDEEPLSTSSLTDFHEEDREAEITCYDDDHAFPSTANNAVRRLLSSESGRGSFQEDVSVSEDCGQSGISIDFLSDPHPWESINRILKLESPGQSAVHAMNVNFTKDREGVGYISPERSDNRNARPSDASFFEIRINHKPAGDVRATSSPGRPTRESEVSILHNLTTIDTPNVSCASNNSMQALFDAGPHDTPTEIDPKVSVRALQEPPSTPSTSVVSHTQEEHASPLAISVRSATAESDMDMIFDGPCLFGDSDLEEDE